MPALCWGQKKGACGLSNSDWRTGDISGQNITKEHVFTRLLTLGVEEFCLLGRALLKSEQAALSLSPKATMTAYSSDKQCLGCSAEGSATMKSIRGFLSMHKAHAD